MVVGMSGRVMLMHGRVVDLVVGIESEPETITRMMLHHRSERCGSLNVTITHHQSHDQNKTIFRHDDLPGTGGGAGG